MTQGDAETRESDSGDSPSEESPEFIELEQNGIKCRKAVKPEADFSLVEYVLISDERVGVRLDEALPLGITADQIFYNDEEGDQGKWTSQGVSVLFECELAPGEQVTTVYAIAQDQRDEEVADPEEVCDALIDQEPTIRRVDPDNINTQSTSEPPPDQAETTDDTSTPSELEGNSDGDADSGGDGEEGTSTDTDPDMEIDSGIDDEGISEVSDEEVEEMVDLDEVDNAAEAGTGGESTSEGGSDNEEMGGDGENSDKGVTAEEAGGSLDMLDDGEGTSGETTTENETNSGTDSSDKNGKSKAENGGREISATDAGVIETRTADGGETEDTFAGIGADGMALNELTDDDDDAEVAKANEGEQVTEDEGEQVTEDEGESEDSEENSKTSDEPAAESENDTGAEESEGGVDLADHDSVTAALVGELRNGTVDAQVKEELRSELISDDAGAELAPDGITEINDRLDAIEEELPDDANERIRSLHQDVDEVDSLAQEINENLENFRNEVKKVAKRVQEVEEQAEEAEEQADDAYETATSAKDEAESVQDRLEETEEMLEEMQDLRDKLKGMLAALSDDEDDE